MARAATPKNANDANSSGSSASIGVLLSWSNFARISGVIVGAFITAPFGPNSGWKDLSLVTEIPQLPKS